MKTPLRIFLAVTPVLLLTTAAPAAITATGVFGWGTANIYAGYPGPTGSVTASC